jgi:hypothetical protein
MSTTIAEADGSGNTADETAAAADGAGSGSEATGNATDDKAHNKNR